MKLIEETDKFECPECGGDSVRQILMPMGEEKFYRCLGSIMTPECEFSWKESEAWKFTVRERRERYYSAAEYERLKDQRRIFFKLTEQTELDLDLNCIACGTRPHEKDMGHMIHCFVPHTGYNSWTLIHNKCLEKHEGDFEPPPIGQMTVDTSKVELVFICNGEDVSVKVPEVGRLLRDARDTALEISGNTGRPMDDWEVRDINGRLMSDLDKPVQDIASGSRFFLTLKVGVGG